MRRATPYPLWIGHVGDVREVRAIRAEGIGAFVDLALNEPMSTVYREAVYCRFPLHDGAGNEPWLLRAAVTATADLLRSEIPTLVFCGAGMSRSVSIAAAAVALAHDVPLNVSLRSIVQAGPADVAPDLWRCVCDALRDVHGVVVD